MTVEDIQKQSVTRHDNVLHFVPWYGYGYGRGGVTLPTFPPEYWSRERDAVLRSTVHHSAVWGNAIAIAVSKMASLTWQVESDRPLRRNRAYDLLHSAGGGGGWVGFLAKHLRDFLTTDNGAFVEIVRSSSARGSRIIGLVHLDSMRCYRTGNPAEPVQYQDLQGRMHTLRDYQVFSISHMPTPDDSLAGVGICSASTAYSAIVKSEAIETYFVEKVSGTRPLAIHFLSGVSSRQLNDALATADEQQASRGLIQYKGVAMVPVLGDVPVQVVSVPIAEIPDAYNVDTERQDAQLAIALSVGIDPQALNPALLARGALGTGAQSVVIANKEKGSGLAAWRQAFTHALNWHVFPERVTFSFQEADLQDESTRADIAAKRGDFVARQIEVGSISPQQALQYLVDEGELPEGFLPVDETPGGVVSSEEKPDDEQAEPAMRMAEPSIDDYTQKQVGDVGLTIERELPAARLLYEEVSR